MRIAPSKVTDGGSSSMPRNSASARSSPASPASQARRGAARVRFQRAALLVDARLGATAQRVALAGEGRARSDEAAHVRAHADVDHASRLLVAGDHGLRPRLPVASIAADMVVVPMRIHHPSHRPIVPGADARDVGVGSKRQISGVDDEHLALAVSNGTDAALGSSG